MKVSEFWHSGSHTQRPQNIKNLQNLHAFSLALSLSFVVVKRRILLFFSDSISSLEAISGFKLEIDIVQNIIKDVL